MARMGQFAGASEEYGGVVSYIQPPDNDFEKGRFTDTLLDPRLDLTKKQRREIQQEIDEFLSLLRLGRDA
jgi:hypothetical protein